MMKIYIIRHGETQWNKEEVFRGRKDISLNETGKKQVERVGLYFSHRPINRIVSSPLARARQTAEAIGNPISIAIETMEELTDFNFGIWEGLSLREVEKRFPADFAIWKTSPEKLRIENGETLAMVRNRISAGLANITSGQEGAVVIVTHRVICKIIVLHALGIGNEHFWDMKYDPGSITLLDRKNDKYTLIFSNDTCHLYNHAYLDF
jgi:broad specificity phosphatase PhoE